MLGGLALPQTSLLYQVASPPVPPARNFVEHRSISHRIWIVSNHMDGPYIIIYGSYMIMYGLYMIIHGAYMII